MNEEKLNRVLPLIFRQVKIPEQAKGELRRRLFDNAELLDDDLMYVTAAGDPAELERKNQNGVPLPQNKK